MQNQENDIRWEQRFSNYCKALSKLEEGVKTAQLFQELLNDPMEELGKEGIIQRFEYTHELAWKVMKDFANYQGDTSITGSRDATRAAFRYQLFTDAEGWMDMIKDRNVTSHTYDESTAQVIYAHIINVYLPLFIQFKQVMEAKRNSQQDDIFSKP